MATLITPITQARAAQVADILNDNVPQVRLYLPTIVTVTRQQMQSLFNSPNVRGWANIAGGAMNGFLLIRTNSQVRDGVEAGNTGDDVLLFFIRIADRLPFNTDDPILETRLILVARDLLAAWANDAAARGATLLRGSYHVAGHRAMHRALDRMELRNGRTATYERNGTFRTYHVTPAELLLAVGGI